MKLRKFSNKPEFKLVNFHCTANMHISALNILPPAFKTFIYKRKIDHVLKRMENKYLLNG